MSARPEPGTVVPLPLSPNHSVGRSPVTCEYRCGNACPGEAPNTSANEYFGEVVATVISRRGAIKAAAVIGMGMTAFNGVAAAEPFSASTRGRSARGVPGAEFPVVAPNTRDEVVVPDGYQRNVVITWGDPVLPGAPAFDIDNQTPEAQATQFGYNNDFCAVLVLDRRAGVERYLMVSNHEYTNENNMFPGWDPRNATEEQSRIAWAAHGMTVVVVERDRDTGELKAVVDERYNRRITLSTPFEMRGPAAGSEHLRTSADPTGRMVLGTQNNCAGGVTPWGTVLSGEENFNQYFGNANKITDPVVRARLARYGMSGGATTRKWEKHDKRFDLAQEPNEANRFGWIVEIDPFDKTLTPVKHTALGRFKHEGANIHLTTDGRVVAYMGDDERFDYLYKFVSDGRMKKGGSTRARDHNMRLLDSGTLYVAKFTGDSPTGEINGSGGLPGDGEFDGSGVWIPLAHNHTSFVEGMTAEEVYLFTRLAADRVGPTRMDRPEDVEPHPVTGRVYAALTNNSDRGATGRPGADEPNPRNRNKHGHVLELREDHDDATATTFTWRLLIVCGDPAAADTYFGGVDKATVSPISCPDNLAFDGHGNLWISTDGNQLGAHDGLFAVPLEGPWRGQTRQFLTVPVDAEACGPVIEENFVLISVQHPGENGTLAAPTSHWPGGGTTVPRPAVVAIHRADGGRIGMG